ncbi:hypothetical protein GE09DRAFT_350626 [Coniochaeta sp. 2T2.1]|nr:hypothetical protein GE09DRAFT_350626 [Coniochaeta sp. 2T2.1]
MTTSWKYLLPDTSDPRYTDCLAPAGDQFSFSPAVCPQGWPAWLIGKTSAALSRAATATAYCCAPSYSMLFQDTGDDPSPSSEHVFATTTSSSGAAYADTITLSVARLPAWHISWQTTDMSTLSPRPPALDEGERFTRWVPGSKPEREKQDYLFGGNSALFWFTVVSLSSAYR